MFQKKQEQVWAADGTDRCTVQAQYSLLGVGWSGTCLWGTILASEGGAVETVLALAGGAVETEDRVLKETQ